MNWLNSIDTYLFRLINSAGYADMDPVMILISSEWFWIPLYIILLYLLFKKFKNNLIWILIAIIALIFLSDFGSVHLFKNIFERLRPCYQFNDIRIVDGCGGLFSFVSSHASNAFAIAFFIGLLFKNIWGFIHLFSWAVIIGFSRIYLGVHFPFDIVGGMFWGLFVSLLTYKLLKLRINEAV